MVNTTDTAKKTWKTGHVGLNVTDLEKSTEFYKSVFGFAVGKRSDEPGREFVFLCNGERIVLTLWKQSSGPFAKDTPGLHHLSFEVETAQEVRDVEYRLRAVDATVLHGGVVPHSEGSASGGVFFTDPDGIRLEVYSPDAGVGIEAPVGSAPTCGFF